MKILNLFAKSNRDIFFDTWIIYKNVIKKLSAQVHKVTDQVFRSKHKTKNFVRQYRFQRRIYRRRVHNCVDITYNQTRQAIQPEIYTSSINFGRGTDLAALCPKYEKLRRNRLCIAKAGARWEIFFACSLSNCRHQLAHFFTKKKKQFN